MVSVVKQCKNGYSAIKVMRLLGWQTIVGLILTIASGPALDVKSVPPGTLTCVVGEAWIGSESLNEKAVGKVAVKPGPQLSTRNGTVEIMLAPDIFMRVGKDSSANLISLNNTTVKVELQRGQAIVEISGLPKDRSIHLLNLGLFTQLLTKGLYEFDADRGQFRVFRGEAFVRRGNQSLVVTSKRQFALTHADLSASRFNKKEFEQADPYRFNRMRSNALAQADARHWEPYYWPGWHGSGRRTFLGRSIAWDRTRTRLRGGRWTDKYRIVRSFSRALRCFRG
jgi:hypothetical protein